MSFQIDAITEQFEHAHAADDCATLSIGTGSRSHTLLHGGADAATLFNVYSLSKLVVVLAVVSLVEAGELSLEDRIQKYWPSFASGQGADITVNHVLSHASGMAYFSPALVTEDFYNWSRVISALEQTSPLHAAGSAVVYHARTFGFILGELVQRIAHIPFCEYVARYITEPAQAQFKFGLSVAEQVERVRLLTLPQSQIDSQTLEALDSTAAPIENKKITEVAATFAKTVFENPFNPILAPNETGWMSSVIPSSGGFSQSAEFIKLMRFAFDRWPTLRRMLSEPCPPAQDLALGFQTKWKLGFMQNMGEFGKDTGRVGMRAIGGSLYFYDLARDLHFCYTTSKMIPQLGRHPAHDPRLQKILNMV